MEYDCYDVECGCNDMKCGCYGVEYLIGCGAVPGKILFESI